MEQSISPMDKQSHSLMRKTLTQFVACVALLLLLATPLFYWLTKSFYAEDMIDLIEAVQQGHTLPAIDLEQDILIGLVIQFALIATILGVAIVVVLGLQQKRLWKSFDTTLRAIEDFHLEDNRIPPLPTTTTTEFLRLNAAVQTLMQNSLRSYRLQKEFTENASHEMQTPLAVFQSKLDLLLQQPDLTESQAQIIQELYQNVSRLSRLNRSLLLLAKIENSQFALTAETDLVEVVQALLPYLDSLTTGLTLHTQFLISHLPMKANRALVESLVSNLVVNAIRHNQPGGEVALQLSAHSLTVSNTSTEPALDPTLLFRRFYHHGQTGNGLGLSIVKAICDYHGWTVQYHAAPQSTSNLTLHTFVVTFSATAPHSN